MLFVGDFVRICTKAVSVTDLMFQQENYVLNHLLWIMRLGVVFMNSKTHMVVMKLVSQHLYEYKNNGLISKLHEFQSGQIWVCCIAWFLINHGLMFDPEIFMVYTEHTGE